MTKRASLRTPRTANRRGFLQGVGLTMLAAGAGPRALAEKRGSKPDPKANPRDRLDAASEALPFELKRVSADRALETWERLRSPTVAPVMLGAPSELPRIAEPFTPEALAGARPVAEILAEAETLPFPKAIRALRETQAAASFAEELDRAQDPMHQARKELMDQLFPLGLQDTADGVDAPLGDWPETEPPGLLKFRAPTDYKTGGPADVVVIALVPTEDPTAVPAHLRWGGWNANPPAEHHVAALRSWRERYGAELVSLTGDTLDLRVTRRPATRAEALELAREQYWYCRDIVGLNIADLSGHAALLMGSNWWRFWWD